jgi:hypothetical protein
MTPADAPDHRDPPVAGNDDLLCPFSLTVDTIARFLNCELTDDPTYDGLELQWFDDDEHGTGLLAFLSRREDRRVDFYVDPSLTLDRSLFVLGAGIGRWTETRFEVGRLQVTDAGVDAEVRFVDVEGRPIEIRIDDRGERRARRGALLAPVGSGVDDPIGLLLVHCRGFDLVRRGDVEPVIRIDGRSASTGTLPGRALHKRELIKYAAPLDAIKLNRAIDGPAPLVDDQGAQKVRRTSDGIEAVIAGKGAHRVRLELRPAFPDLTTLRAGQPIAGRWRILAEDVPPLTGGTWLTSRAGDEVQLALEVTRRWQPGALPPLMRMVTSVVPVFRRWPTTYRWSATLRLGDHPTMTSRWERTGGTDDSYRRATGSAA